MKVTALIPDQLIEEVQTLSKGKNITESVIIALSEWTKTKRLQTLQAEIVREPLKFYHTSEELRDLNRQ